ncbi:MAG: PDZ domain-containing protein [Ruminococcaceae bacterium]|jgi:hypothetical protein|nr:PDZ domain-containing protein [Oscillospiraceae bacterium]
MKTNYLTIDWDSLSDGCVLRIPAGVVCFSEPVRLTGKRNIRVIGEDGAVFRGTVPLRREDFAEIEPGVYSVPMPVKADGFYIGGRRYEMARYPKRTDPDAPYGGYAADCILPEKTKDWDDPAGGYIHAMHRHLWGGYSYRIEGKNPDGTLRLSGGWQNNRQMGMHEEFRIAENIREEMTEPGEWFYDERESRILFRPVPGDDLDEAEAVVSEGFFLLENCENVTFENIVFERSARTFMKTKEPLLRSDWTIYRGGAVTFRDSKGCAIDRCSFREIGSNGVFEDGNCEEIAVTRSSFLEIGASGICFVGRPDAVRSPLFEYNETQTLDSIDLTPGPKSENYPKRCRIEDCLIDGAGRVEKQASGVEISMAFGITVKDCTICHTSRAGINLSEGTFGGHRIEGCDVFDTVRETGDHGSFNSWGRDRYWHLCGLDDRDAGRYARLDMLAPNEIVRNRFRCDRGWDIDLDDGSSWFFIEENLCLNGGIKLREGFFRTVRRNICVNNGLHFHAWYPESGDRAEDNIVFAPYSVYVMPEVWGDSIDRNTLVDPDSPEPVPARELSGISGQDAASVKRSVRFRSPETGDYRTDSVPGFDDFPTEFGVRYEPLRKIARTPQLPALKTAEKTAPEAASRVRLSSLGLVVKDIETDGEMSVYGTAGHSGALVTETEDGSFAQGLGLLPGDVIVSWNGRPIRRASDLEEERADGEGEHVPVLRVLRKQRETVLGSDSWE